MGSYFSNIASRSNGIPDVTGNNFLMKPAGSSAGKKESNVAGIEDDKNDLLQDSFSYSPVTNPANVQHNENKKAAISHHIQKNIVPGNYLQLHIERNIVESSQQKLSGENQKEPNEQRAVAGADVVAKNEQGTDLKSSIEHEVTKIPPDKETIHTEISSQQLVDPGLSSGPRLAEEHNNEKHNKLIIANDKEYISNKKSPEQKTSTEIRPSAVHNSALLQAQQNKKSNLATKLFIGRITIELVKKPAPVIKNNPVLRQHKSTNNGSKPVHDQLNKLRFGLEQM